MRQYQTYLLRILIDQEAAEAGLHGSLKAIGEQQVYPFKSAQGLLTLLQRLTQSTDDHRLDALNDQEEL